MDFYDRKPFIRWLKKLGYERDGLQRASNICFSRGDVKILIASDKTFINLYKKSGNFYHVVMHWSSIHENMTDEELLFTNLGDKRCRRWVKFDELVKVIRGGD
jgi:hypothetical protein